MFCSPECPAEKFGILKKFPSKILSTLRSVDWRGTAISGYRRGWSKLSNWTGRQVSRSPCLISGDKSLEWTVLGRKILSSETGGLLARYFFWNWEPGLLRAMGDWKWVTRYRLARVYWTISEIVIQDPNFLRLLVRDTTSSSKRKELPPNKTEEATDEYPYDSYESGELILSIKYSQQKASISKQMFLY